MDKHEFSKRRQTLLKQMGPASIAILPTAQEHPRNNDMEFQFRPNSDFYYFTGFAEPEAVAVFIPGRAAGEYILFNRERDKVMEIWNGKRAGQQGAIEEYGADQSFSIHQFATMLSELLQDKKTVYYPIAGNIKFEKTLNQTLKTLRSKSRSAVSTPQTFVNLDLLAHEMRFYKSPAEIELMKTAGKISADAHCRAIRACRPGMKEYELEAELLYEFYRRGSRYPAYGSIVASGENACILHYQENNREMKDGDLVLVDAACEYEYYASDITRTYPVNGRFSKEQQAIYELVLAVQLECIKNIRPGLAWDAGQNLTVKLITQGLKDLGLLQGEVDQLIETKAYMLFYMHRVSHLIGIDAHDQGFYVKDGQWRALEKNMAFTVEPGIYISAGTKNVDEKWWNIGVRIEDDIIVTETGCEVITGDVPKTVSDIEALMRK